ncbi:hypothetical protein N7532_010017 [Penicillium argentinense]|uniref:LDB19 N-terminal domain-containing protein n=1 Tax=Penicillium argentinense TaxID=1131581 RepID=A0A9W9JXQ7_9EURO|nr:uncharacterized protein N7532_010017 [Penicillium argentinense]KAJ5085246.1 hypothetical protein N7532_010017 [Penicillium argentinense]
MSITTHLTLRAPTQHDVYHNLRGDSYCQPLSGSAVFTSYKPADIADLSEIRICLIRVVSRIDRDETNNSGCLLGRLSRLKQPCTKPAPLHTTQNCCIVQEVTVHEPVVSADTQEEPTRREERTSKVSFQLSIPANLAATTITELADVSYVLVASAVTSNGRHLNACHELRIIRQIIPDRPSIQNTRMYSGLNLITKIILTQGITSVATSNMPLNVEVFVRPTRPADRPMEYRCVAIRGIRWRVEEITKIFYQPDLEANNEEVQPIEEQSSTQEIFSGIQKGYWKAEKNQSKMEHSARQQDPSVEISFQIAAPRGINAASEINIENYDPSSKSLDSIPSELQESFSSTTSRRMLITVEHQIKLDIFSSEDTFCVVKHTLVDRKPLQTALNACFPLRITDRGTGNVGEDLNRRNPPRYEEIPESPPGYDRALR